MLKFIKVLQMIFSLSIIGLVFVQSKEGGLSSFVGSSAKYRSRRGMEKVIFTLTIIVGVFFSVNSLVLLYMGG